MSKKNTKSNQKATDGQGQSTIHTDKRAAKKTTVLGTEKKRRPPVYTLAAIALLVLVSAVYGWTHFKKKGIPVAENFSANTNGSQVSLAVGQFDDGKARHYEYRDGDLKIKYFVIKSSDGVIRAAFDACDVCWPAGKGYYQSGDVMVCRNCGRQFKSVLVNEVKGGCNPAPLNRTVQGDRLVIEVKNIIEGKQYFDFPGKV
jgi:uncharacterized membrane protein